MTKTQAMPRTLCEHPDPTKQGTRIDTTRYDAMRRALLAVIPKRAAGVPFGSLRDAAAAKLAGSDVFAGASLGWYVTTVKLDLEARGLIERVPGVTPQHVRRTKGSR